MEVLKTQTEDMSTSVYHVPGKVTTQDDLIFLKLYFFNFWNIYSNVADFKSYMNSSTFVKL